MSFSQRYALLRSEIAAAAREAGRDPAAIRIVAVSKFQSPESIAQALAAGVTDFGENYVQEARRKWAPTGSAALRQAQDDKDVSLHFLGHVQTNKANAIAQTFDVVQSVDRAAAADALSRAAEQAGKVLPVLLQLNISPAERFGCLPAEAPALAARVRSLPGLRLDGVMAIGPLTPDRAAVRGAFEVAAAVHREAGGPVLSLGMSGDWREALAAGSTMLRIGTSLFGPRPAADLAKKAANGGLYR